MKSVKRFRIEVVLNNGMRVIVTESSDRRSIAMFEKASKTMKKGG